MTVEISIAACVQLIADMIEEAQREANYAEGQDRVALLAKRDALTEVKFRLRDGRCDYGWARRVPSNQD